MLCLILKPESHAPVRGVDLYGHYMFMGCSGRWRVIEMSDGILKEAQMCLEFPLRPVRPFLEMSCK